MEIRHTGRNEIEILLSLDEAQHVARYGFDSLNKFHPTGLIDLSKAILKEDEIQADITEGGYGQ